MAINQHGGKHLPALLWKLRQSPSGLERKAPMAWTKIGRRNLALTDWSKTQIRAERLCFQNLCFQDREQGCHVSVGSIPVSTVVLNPVALQNKTKCINTTESRVQVPLLSISRKAPSPSLNGKRLNTCLHKSSIIKASSNTLPGHAPSPRKTFYQCNLNKWILRSRCYIF